MTHTATRPTGNVTPAFWITLGINFLWVNTSEVFRYFVLLRDRIQEAVPGVPGAAPMDFGIFMIWGVWDTILVFVVTGGVWLLLERFGHGVGNALLAATAVWVACFVLLWVGLWNMGLTSLEVVAIALTFSWIELAVSGLIVNWGMQRFTNTIL